ncbi:Protein FAR1-RELATED SEQUENCE 5 [Abeliophyllum distichum]|uniref:Protein FAR1-RELATED SEQUENCE n=1 Tax=Abeliophyllum distichum TaxID=126358 RepID=A0ABD1PTG3_9LAMI
MSNQAPPVLITDQDAAIAKALSIVMPVTFHRFCIWHILNKSSEKINVMLYNEQYHRLVHIIKDSETPDEFEQRWNEAMELTNLGCNEWLSTMYDIRSRWVPAYVNHIFSAGMSSSQRSESGHSFFKKYVNKKNSLMGFITRFNRALTHQRHEELVCNHVDLNEQPRILSMVMMEEQMVRIYTKKIFLLFQKEIIQSNKYICTKKVSSGKIKQYSMQRFESGSNFHRQRQLTYYIQTDYVSCSCRTFDFEGYPCRHMVCFFKKKQVLLLHQKYILRRWTKNAKVGISYGDSDHIYGEEEGADKSLMARHGLLAHKAAILVDDASLTDARSTYLLGEFENLHLRVKEIDIVGNTGIPIFSSKSQESQQFIEDPGEVRAKGCGKRLKSSKEKALSNRNRQCSVCGAAGHDKRTCPSLNSRSNVHTYDIDNTPNEPGEHDTFTTIGSSNFQFGL